MGLFKSKGPRTTGNELDETAPIQKSPRQEVFHGTLADIHVTPKTDLGKTDSRLEDINRQTFF